MKNPKHSIIIPAYNTGNAIRKCIDSIIAQSYTDWELIIVDDGSKDETPAIIDEYAQRDLRIRAIHIPNGGVSNARNVGLDHAQGEYVMFVDSDDWIEADYLQQVEARMNDDADIYITGISLDYENESEIYYSVIKGASCYAHIHSCNLAKKIGYLIQTMNMESSCLKNYRRSFLMKYDVKFSSDMIIFEDFHFVIQCLISSPSITLIPYISYHYCIPIDYNPCKRRGYRDLYPSLHELFVALDRLIETLALKDYSKEIALKTITAKISVLTSQSLNAQSNMQKIVPFKQLSSDIIFKKYKKEILAYSGGRFKLQHFFFSKKMNYLAYLCNRFL